MRPWKTLSRRTILRHSKYLTVEVHDVELPDGRVISDWPWVIGPDFVNVAAVTAEGKFLCFRQVKYGISGTSLAPVGGYLEAGEEPLAAAQRELLEETGCKASEWIDLGRYRLSANRGVGTAYFFLATGARRVAAADSDDLEEQELLFLAPSEVGAALDAGQFKIVPWTAIMGLALRRYDEGAAEGVT